MKYKHNQDTIITAYQFPIGNSKQLQFVDELKRENLICHLYDGVYDIVNNNWKHISIDLPDRESGLCVRVGEWLVITRIGNIVAYQLLKDYVFKYLYKEVQDENN